MEIDFSHLLVHHQSADQTQTFSVDEKLMSGVICFCLFLVTLDLDMKADFTMLNSLKLNKDIFLPIMFPKYQVLLYI